MEEAVFIGVLHPHNIVVIWDWYRLVTVNTHSDFIMLLHWEIRPAAP